MSKKSPVKYDEAVEAVKVFRSMQFGLSMFARALTKRNDVQVIVSKSNGSTDGKNIFFRPPISLGRHRVHKRSLCDKRDENLQLLCKACGAREDVMAIIYHEISHIAFNSFGAVSDIAKLEITKRIMREHGGKKGSVLVKRFNSAPPIMRSSYIAMANFINPFFPLILNAIEDARVNTEMIKARKGIRVMMEANVSSIMENGVRGEGEKVTLWSDRPLNSQIMVGIFMKAMDYQIEGRLSEKVVEDLNSPALASLLEGVAELTDVESSYNLAFDVLVAIRDLGYCKQEYDEEEEEDESTEEPTPEPPPFPGFGIPGDGVGSPIPGPEGGEETGTGGTGEPDSESGAGEAESDHAPSGEAPDGEGEDDHSVPPGRSTDEATDTPAGRSPEDPEDAPGASGGRPEEENDSSGGSSDIDGPEDARDGSGSEPLDSLPDDEGEGDALQEESSDGLRGDDADDAGADDSGAVVVQDWSSVDEGQSVGNGTRDPSPWEESESGGTSSDSDSQPVEGDRSDLDDGPSEADGHSDHDGDAKAGGGVDGDSDALSSIVPPLEYGDAEDAERDLERALGHEKMEQAQDDRITAEAIGKAVIQAEYFDEPSGTVYATEVHKFGDPSVSRYHSWGGRSKITQVAIDEQILSKALLHARVTFSANKRAKNEHNLKSGKVDPRVLGKRAFGDDPRLFRRKTLPKKRDYFVVIGIDMSGSTAQHLDDGVTACELQKRSAFAQAEVLHRLGVPFSVFAHSGSYTDQGGSSGYMLDIYEVKGPNQAWATDSKTALRSLGPAMSNLDGHTLEFYRKQLDAANATDKVIMYHTDGGMPAENYDEELAILQRELKVCKQKGYTVLGVGVGTDDPIEYGLDTVRVDADADIVNVVKHLERRLAGV